MEKTYTVTLEDAADGSGELIMPIPDQMMKELGWELGDELEFQAVPNSKSFVISNKSRRSI